MRAHAFGGADYRTEIVRVAYLVADYDEGGFAALFGDGEDVVHRAVLPHGGQRHNALMRVRLTHEVQLAPVRLDNDYACAARLRRDMTQRFIDIALGDKNFVNCTTGTQCLNNCVSALNNVVFYNVLFHYALQNNTANIITST